MGHTANRAWLAYRELSVPAITPVGETCVGLHGDPTPDGKRPVVGFLEAEEVLMGAALVRVMTSEDPGHAG
jgi:hypothetical protein